MIVSCLSKISRGKVVQEMDPSAREAQETEALMAEVCSPTANR